MEAPRVLIGRIFGHLRIQKPTERNLEQTPEMTIRRQYCRACRGDRISTPLAWSTSVPLLPLMIKRLRSG